VERAIGCLIGCARERGETREEGTHVDLRAPSACLKWRLWLDESASEVGRHRIFAGSKVAGGVEQRSRSEEMRGVRCKKAEESARDCSKG
jgi:hypothetical protein